MLTPGYRVLLGAGGREYEYRTNAKSTLVRLAGSPDTLAYQSVEITEARLTIQVPSSWQQLSPEWAWTPLDGTERRVGLKWVDLQPPLEAEAVMLPNHSQVLRSEPVELGWATGRRITLEV